MANVRKDHVTLEETKQALTKMKDFLGRNPFQHEYRPLYIKLKLRTYKRISRLYPEVNATTFYDFLEKLGFEDVKYPQPSEYIHKKLFKEIDPKGIPEYPLEIEGKRYRIDYRILYKTKPIYIEVDGSSHETPKSKYLRAHKDPAEAFRKKKERDALVETHLKRGDQILVRFKYHHLISLTVEQVKAILDQAVEGVEVIKPLRHSPEEIQKLYDSGMTRLEVISISGISPATITRLNKDANLICPIFKQVELRYAETLKLISEGKQKPEIASNLNISPSSVGNYKKKIRSVIESRFNLTKEESARLPHGHLFYKTLYSETVGSPP